MATAGSKKDGSVNEMTDAFDAMSLKTAGKGQQTLDIQECWSEAKVRISGENWGEEKVLTGTPASSLQYLVQRKSKGLNEALKEFGCSVDEKNSQKFLTICLTKKLPSDEAWDMNNWEKIVEKIQVACDQICSKYISLKESELPFLVNEFSEDEKRCFEHNVQVIHATVDQYVLVGLKDEGKKSSEFLEKLCKEVLIEKIEDREIFDGLKLRENLEANFRNVKIKDEQSHLVLRGSKENVAECRQCYRNWFSLNVPDPGCKSKKISKTLYNKLISEQKRKDINKSLKKEGFCVYWRVSFNEHCFFLICYGLNEPRLGDALELVKREGEETDKGAKPKNYPKEHERILEHTAGVLKIKRGITFEYVESMKKKIEEKTSCSISLAKRDAEEPTYYKSWLLDKINFVIAEGSVENSVTDIIVCPVDENFQPAGESAERIFQKGGWTELQKAAQYCKSNCKFHNDPAATDAKNCICLSPATGSLNCRKILFLSMKGNLDLLWNKLRDELAKQTWRSLSVPAEDLLLMNGKPESILDVFLIEKKISFFFEIVFCIPTGRSEDLKQLENICNDHLQYYPISFYIEDTRRNGGAVTCSCPLSPIEAKVETGSILEFADKVDVIVNSTKQSLVLDEGHVSNLILRHGGKEIQDDLNTHYIYGIGIGDIAVSMPGKLKCCYIIHCVLLNWIATGNLSIKILSSVVKKCLHYVDLKGHSSIAIPALGTGKLSYSYIHVARTMLKAVEEYGKAFPETSIKRVLIVLHPSDQECMRTFSHVLGTKSHAYDFSLKDLLSRPAKIQYLENRMPVKNLLIQLMSEDIDEPVDAIINFKLGNSASRSTRFQPSDQVNLVWNTEKMCYTATFSLDQQSENLESAVGTCFNLLQSKRMTSTRIDIRDIGTSGNFEKVMDAFCKNLTSAFTSSTKINTGKEETRYLKKLQILTRLEEIQKVKQTEPKKTTASSLTSWFTKLWKGECDKEWRVVNKKQDKDLICCVRGPTKDTTVKVLETLRREIGVDSMPPGLYCFDRDYKCRLLSKVCNMKLCEAEEIGLQNVDIKSEDEIMYSYNLEEMERHQKESRGDARKEKLYYIKGRSQIPFPLRTTLWCVEQNQIRTFLPMRCCELLNKAVKDKDSIVIDDENYEYDLNAMKRKKRTADGGITEDILIVEAEENKELRDIKKVQNEKPENVVQIFESVSGKISFGNNRDENQLKGELEKFGCTVTSIENNWIEIKGNLSQLRDVSKCLRNQDKKTESLESDNFSSVIAVPMSERDYKVLMHFGGTRDWFKQYRNSINFDEHGLACIVPTNEYEKIKKNIEEHLQEVKQMSSVCDQITEESKESIQDLAKQYPNVHLLVNDNSIEIISDNYEDVVSLQVMLKPKAPVRTNRRATRTFAKNDNAENQGASSPSNDVYNAGGNTFDTVAFNSQTTTPSGTLEMKTAKGLLIKVYTGSITKLNVDCIVNAANENLMHGGGVAAAISDAAGYQFDQESAQYIADNGPVPVGSCCVTSAGKLPYRCVIHTVGPRWSDYRDSNVCLELLQKSVEVTFKTADTEGMSSVAIPAISSGIFGVPREKCVEQYYKAAMSFCSTYKCKNLREIHFVDRDESIVRAIKEVFQQKQPATSKTAMSKNLLKQDDTMEDTKSLDVKNKTEMPASMPPPSGYTIVTVTDTLQIKIYLGSITDIAADVIVCPQDEFCSSDNPIARSIFSKEPGPKPLRNQMKQGQTLSQIPSDASPWKMIIHAVFPIYSDNYAKNPSKFGSQFYPMFQTLITTADERRYHSIAIPLLIEGKGDFQAPIELCAFRFYKAVTDVQSKLACVKEIYLVLRNEDDEHIFVDMFKDAVKITQRPLLKQSNNFGSNKKFAKTLTSKPEEEEMCCICMDTPNNPKKLQKCGHVFCTGCIEECFKYKPACPSCGQIYGKMTGDQPPGTILIRKEYQTLEGFTDCKGTIVLTYSFHGGRQGEEHPNPGTPYKGIYRSGYVPNNEKGRLVAKLLNVAFSRRLVFTIGNSRTTGEDGVITWNDIHHKTRTHGGPQRFGYPDPTYLDRVLEELAAKGVTPESADDPQEYTEYSRAMRY